MRALTGMRLLVFVFRKYVCFDRDASCAPLRTPRVFGFQFVAICKEIFVFIFNSNGPYVSAQSDNIIIWSL